MDNKRKWILPALLVCALIGFVCAAAAVSPLDVTVRNLITTGSVSLRIEEKSLENGVEKDYAEPVGGVPFLPGTSISRVSYMENTGSVPFYLRARAVVSVTGDDGPLPADVICLRVDDRHWLAGGDGWLYYSDVVEPGPGNRVCFFDSVSFDGNAAAAYENSEVKIVVEGQAVQAKNNPLAKGASPVSAAGWPEQP